MKVGNIKVRKGDSFLLEVGKWKWKGKNIYNVEKKESFTWPPLARALPPHWRVQDCHRNLSTCKFLSHYCEAFFIRSMGLESKMTKVEFIQEFVWEKSKVLKPYVAIYIAKYIAICYYIYYHICEYISVEKSKGLEPYIARWWSKVDIGDYSNEVL